MNEGEACINDIYVGEGFGAGDMLYRLDASANMVPHYWNVANGGWSKSKAYFSANKTPIAKGEAFYVKKISAGEVTFSGKVATSAIPFGSENGNNWAIVCPTWPESNKTLADITWQGMQNGDRLYRLDASANMVPRYWNASKGGWSKSKAYFSADTTPLAEGEAVYINKQSASVGSMTVN